MSEIAGERLRVATYNVRGCRGMDGRRSETRIAEVIAAVDADVIGLQELDANRRRSGGVDQARVIAIELGWHWVFHPALRTADELYGNAILSRYPVRLQQAKELPTAMALCRETRGAIWAEIEAPGGPIQLINTHLGLGRRERWMQCQLLAGPEWLGRVSADEPVILMGDLNSLPRSPAFRLLAQQLRAVRSTVTPSLRLPTFPTRYPLLALDHILVNDRLPVSSVSVFQNDAARMASDHFPLIADLRRA
jgi:endonuclease/exonuclease/phosphatase family metal-dependent hydrolase